MTYQEMVKAKFEAQTAENFAMCIMRFKGKEYCQFFKIVDIGNPSELRDIAEGLRKALVNVFIKKGAWFPYGPQ